MQRSSKWPGADWLLTFTRRRSHGPCFRTCSPRAILQRWRVRLTPLVRTPGRRRWRGSPPLVSCAARRAANGSTSILLSQYLLHHAAVDVGEPERAPAVPEGEPFVIKAKLVQDCGMQVVHVDAILDRQMPEFVRGPK